MHRLKPRSGVHKALSLVKPDGPWFAAMGYMYISFLKINLDPIAIIKKRSPMSMYKLKFTSTINIGSNKSPVWIATIDVLAVSKLN